MKIKEVQTWKFSELTEDQQQKALDNYRDINVNYDWWDFLYEQFKEDLAAIGISADTFYFDTDRNSFFSMKSPSVSDEKLFLKYCKVDLRTKKARDIIESGLTIETKYFAGARTENYITLHYQYEQDLTDCLQDKLQSFLVLLEKEYDWLLSDESVKETLITNEYDFNEYGKIF